MLSDISSPWSSSKERPRRFNVAAVAAVLICLFNLTGRGAEPKSNLPRRFVIETKPIALQAPPPEPVPEEKPEPAPEADSEEMPTDVPIPAPPAAIDSVHTMRRVPVVPIDLATALTLAGVQNPELLLAQTRISESMARRQLAAAQFLPTINFGTSFDGHVGTLQQSSGNILNVQRSSLFYGMGASAIAAGTVNIPGIVWNFNASEAIYNSLMAKQMVVQRQFESQAARNEQLLLVVHAYLDLLEANGLRTVQMSVRDSSSEVARITRTFARTGQGLPSDADRAATELVDRNAELLMTEAATSQPPQDWRKSSASTPWSAIIPRTTSWCRM